jgi:hypothetical protein
MSKIETNTIAPSTGTTLTLGESGDTVQVGSGVTNNLGVTEIDQWRLTGNTNTGSNAVVSSNWERVDDAQFSYLGNGMSQSSGVFTFGATGYFQVLLAVNFRLDAGDFAEVKMEVTTNNSTYDTIAKASAHNLSSSGDEGFMALAHGVVDVTDTSNVKLRLSTSSMGSGSQLKGSTDQNLTSLTFTKLANT